MKRALAALAAVGIAVGLGACRGGGGPDASDAEAMCERAIKGTLVGSVRLSSTTSYAENETDRTVRWRVSGNAEGTNALGGPVSSRWYCVAGWTESGGYTIIDVGLTDGTESATVEETVDSESAQEEVVRIVDMDPGDWSPEESNVWTWVDRASGDAVLAWRAAQRDYCATYGCVDPDGPTGDDLQEVAVATMRTLPEWAEATWPDIEPLLPQICELIPEWGGRKPLAMEMSRDNANEVNAISNAYLGVVATGAVCPELWDLDE